LSSGFGTLASKQNDATLNWDEADMTGENPRKRSVGLCCAILAALALIPVILVGLSILGVFVRERRHAENRARLQSPQVYQPAAKQLALYCQSVTEEITDHANGQAWLPAVIRECHPSYGEIGPTGASFEMHGGFDHYGYVLKKDEKGSTKTRNKWDLDFYTEQGSTTLCSVVLGVDEKLSPDELVANAVNEYDREIKASPGDVSLYREKVMFLLGFKRLEAALSTCRDAQAAVPDHWLPRYTAAHLGARLGRYDASAKDLRDWVDANPKYDHYVYLFLFYLREDKTPDALAAIQKALRQPFRESWNGTYSKYYLGCSCAVYALAHGDPKLATAVCDYMEANGHPEPVWAGEIAHIRAAIPKNDATIEAAWVKEHGWPNLYNSNSTQKDNAGVLYPTTPANSEQPR
jgi:tetratricopeptide (TPR) repeat protein